MAQINIKRVYDEHAASDGYRILVDRLWPRGVKKEDLRMDLWAKDIAPSNELRQWYHQDMETRHPEFVRRYAEELAANPEMPGFVRLVESKKIVTLLYAAKDPLGNEAAVVYDYLQGKLKKELMHQ